jgi:YHS domain-containing protein
LSVNAFALDPIFTPWTNNLAIRGYDTVAYFTENNAIKGSGDFEYEWQGATWRFSSQSNLDMFKNEPERFAPQYGGYCAYAVAKNSTASVDPTQFAIVDNKLYLNYNKKIQQQWLKDQGLFIEQADKNWPALLND